MNTPGRPTNSGAAGDGPDTGTAEGRRMLLSLQLLVGRIDTLTQVVTENTRAFQLGQQQKPAGRAMRAGAMRRARRRLAKAMRGRRTRKYFQDLMGGKTGNKLPKGAKMATTQKGGGAAAALGTLAPAITRLLGPLGLLSGMLGQSASGFQMLQKALTLVTAVFAPVFLPNILILSAALLALSDVVMAELFPLLAKWFPFVIKNSIPVLQAFIDAVSWVAGQMVAIINGLIAAVNFVIAQLNKAGAGIAPVAPVAPPAGPQAGQAAVNEKDRREREMVKAEDDRAKQRATELMAELEAGAKRRGKVLPPGYSAQKATELAERERDRRLEEQGVDKDRAEFIRMQDRKPRGGGVIVPGAGDIKATLRDVVQTLKMTAGPKATIGGLEAPRSAAQLALLNVDPIEKRMEQNLLKVIGLMEVIVGQLEDKPAPVMGN